MIFRNSNSIADLYNVFNIIEPISKYYPGFKNLYGDKVIPGVIVNNDEIILAEQKNELVGVSIIKKFGEKKLRALRIIPKYQQTGKGLYLIDESLKRLNEDKPIVSVSEEIINDFSRIFINRYDFDISYVYNGLYRKGKLEYEFNGNKKLGDKSIYF
jgi:hypothetical protein